MVDYVKLAETAQKLVKKNGRLITFVQFSEVLDDATKPWRNNDTPRATPTATLSIPAVFVGPSSLGFKTTVSDLLKNSEQICITATKLDLAKYQEIIDTDGVRWKIDNFEKLKPADTTLLYFFGVSR